ncbi:MAG: hypothetical protein KC438_03665 [Thermomicrobiales bacterium]|nr:hypothetical protein [Thermomicrobiales bacterium]
MRFMLLMYPGPGFDEPFDEAEMPVEAVEEMDNFNKRLSDAGKLLSVDGLHHSSEGAIVSFRNKNKKAVVIDGPFSESKEVLGGYWIIQADSLQEAIDWASQVPVGGTEQIEVRRIQEFDELPQEAQDAAPFERSVATQS